MSEFKAQIVAGSHQEVLARKQSKADVYIGELLVFEDGENKILFQVFDTFYSSQISNSNLEKISGFNLEEGTRLEFINEAQRNYLMLKLKPILSIQGKKPSPPKTLPNQFSVLRALKKSDLTFLFEKQGLFLGNVRSGKTNTKISVTLPLVKTLTHHILVSGTTGKGKSVLMKNILWSATSSSHCANLVFDPHDEYFGRNKAGLKDHEKSVLYFTPKSVPPGGYSLVIDVRKLRPYHLMFSNWSDAQQQTLYQFHKKYQEDWLTTIILCESEENVNEMTLSVLKRKLMLLLDITKKDGKLHYNGVFKKADTGIAARITNALESSKTVIIDTSLFQGSQELLISSYFTGQIFQKYKYYNSQNTLHEKPAINILLEEAPRVLGREVLARSSNVFSSIAREGRKFKIGLTAITQLPSLIPRQVLANINTKIILGTEMSSERRALIESANQDLGSDDRNIASLNVGEAIITSTFTPFAIPLSVPYFDEKIQKNKKQYAVRGLK